MANIEAGSKRLYAHAVMAWAVSLYALRLLWRANQDAVRWAHEGCCSPYWTVALFRNCCIVCGQLAD